MARTAKSQSISFDPELYERMEDRRNKLRMTRSEYIAQLILQDMHRGGPFQVVETDDHLSTKNSRTSSKKKKR